MSTVLKQQTNAYMSVHQAADYLQLNEKKIYALVSEGKIPATKITGKWMFPRELLDKWILNSAHGGVLTDRLIISGSDDPLLYRIVMEFAQETGAHTLISYTPTGTRLGLDLLHAHRVDACCIHWGPAAESKTRHPALIRQYNQQRRWILIRAFRREQGLIVSKNARQQAKNSTDLFAPQYRWAVRQAGAGTQRFLNEILSRQQLDGSLLNTTLTALSDRDAAAAIAMGQADVAPGARSAAAEFGLEFIPYGWETFDFTLPGDIWFRRLFQDMITCLKSTRCQRLAESLGGYDLSDSGSLVWSDQ